MKKKLLTVIILICVFFTFQISAALYPSTVKLVNIFSEVLNVIKKEHVHEVSDSKLIESAISGMLTSLDPYSGYLNKEEYEEMQNIHKGEFGGLGVEVIIDNGLKVVSSIDGTPAFYAGIKARDVIIAVDDESVIKMSPNKAIKKIRGKNGTKVKLSILREGEEKPLEFNLIRNLIKLETVKWHKYGDLGYIRISSFGGQTFNNAKKAILDLNKNRKNLIKGYIIDLRSNPGGLLDQAVYVSELFLEDGIIVSTKGRNKKDNAVYKAHAGSLVDSMQIKDNTAPGHIVNSDNLVKNIPIVVLINGGSASASEILAGALQDHKRAVIMGTKSYGKASVQSVIPIQGFGAMSLTTALYYTPSGRSIQKEGIQPDIIVEQTKIEPLKGNENKLIKHKTPANDIKTTKDEIWKQSIKNDYQLLKAIDLLKNIDDFGKEE